MKMLGRVVVLMSTTEKREKTTKQKSKEKRHLINVNS